MTRIRPPQRADVTAFMRRLFLRTERELIAEINRKRKRGLVDYAEAASLERVRGILQSMVDESWSYVPEMIVRMFYGGTSTQGLRNYFVSLREAHRALKSNGVRGALLADLRRTWKVMMQFRQARRNVPVCL